MGDGAGAKSQMEAPWFFFLPLLLSCDPERGPVQRQAVPWRGMWFCVDERSDDY